MSKNEKGKGLVMVERATSRTLEEGVVKPKYLSRRWGSVLVGSKLGCGMEKRDVSFGIPVGGSLTGSYRPEHIGQVKSLNGHKVCQQDNNGLKKYSVKPALGILEQLEDGGLGPDGLGSLSMGPLEYPTWVCVRGPLLEIQEDKFELIGSFNMESFSEVIGSPSAETSPVELDLSSKVLVGHGLAGTAPPDVFWKR